MVQQQQQQQQTTPVHTGPAAGAGAAAAAAGWLGQFGLLLLVQMLPAACLVLLLLPFVGSVV
jgi:hypothetical protein